MLSFALTVNAPATMLPKSLGIKLVVLGMKPCTSKSSTLPIASRAVPGSCRLCVEGSTKILDPLRSRVAADTGPGREDSWRYFANSGIK
jgi:hypothetical protein